MHQRGDQAAEAATPIAIQRAGEQSDDRGDELARRSFACRGIDSPRTERAERR